MLFVARRASCRLGAHHLFLTPLRDVCIAVHRTRAEQGSTGSGDCCNTLPRVGATQNPGDADIECLSGVFLSFRRQWRMQVYNQMIGKRTRFRWQWSAQRALYMSSIN